VLLLALALVATQALSLFGAGATVAYADESTTVTTGDVVPGQPAGGTIHSFTDSDGNVLFCADFWKGHPSEPTVYTTTGWSGDYALDYIVAHGYSASNPGADVYGVSGDDAHVATNYAVYAEIQGTTALVDGNYASSSPIYQATHALYDAAVAFSTSAGHETAPEAGVSRIWDSGNGSLQRMVGGVAKGSITLTKSSSNTSISDGCTCYSLAGAVYGVYSDAACTTQVGTLTTDANGSAGPLSVKAGTYYVKEVTAPTGYALDTEAHAVTVTSGATTTAAVSDAPQSDPNMLTVAKLDAETGLASPLGAGTLEGAEFTVKYYAGQYTTATLPSTATRTWVLKTDANGKTSILGAGKYPDKYFVSGDALYTNAGGSATFPLGTVTVQETKAPTGYTLTDSTVHLSNITSDGTVESVNTFVGPTVSEQVIRCDAAWSKKDEGTMATMPDVAFLVTSSTTGESHVVVSDENGLVDTANSWAAHDASTNTSDDAVTITKDGTSYTLAEASVAGIKVGDDGVTYTVDDAKLSSAAGIWFSGSTTTSTTADDSLGALPYDTYTVTELRCGSNVGHSTISFTLVAHRDGHDYDLGTIDDKTIGIQTELTSDGAHAANCATATTLTDTVSYSGLVPGTEYTVTGTLHLVADDGTDAGTIKGADGTDVTATTTFTAENASGTVDVPFTFDASELSGKSVVAFESLAQNGATVATHADITDTDQTVTFLSPAIHTTATDKTDGTKTIPAAKAQTITDVVAYENLVVGTEYTVTGTLHVRNADGTDAGTVKGADGTDVTATTTFTAEKSSGEVSLDFTFDASELSGKSVVAFEDLSHDGKTVATHADITDEGQTVHVATTPTGTPTGNLPTTGDAGTPALLVVVLGAIAVFGGWRARRRSSN